LIGEQRRSKLPPIPTASGAIMKSTLLSKAIPRLAGAILALGCGAMSGPAAANYYVVDQRIGQGAVFGFLETNGATGILDSQDFRAWSLELVGVGATTRISSWDPGAFVLDVGQDVTATGWKINFNFSRNDGGFLLFEDQPFSGLHLWCNSSGPSFCLPGKTVAPQYFFDDTAQNIPAFGDPIIAFSMPEPSSWALMLTGCAALGLSAVRRRPRGIFTVPKGFDMRQ
jgi:hypothetical protein